MQAFRGSLQLRPASLSPNTCARPRAQARASVDQPREHALTLQQAAPRTTKAKVKPVEGPMVLVARSLPRVLLLHTGGTLGMQPEQSFETNSGDGHLHLVPGTGGRYDKALRPGGLLDNLLNVVPELRQFAQLDVKVVFNKDSSNVGPKEWCV